MRGGAGRIQRLYDRLSERDLAILYDLDRVRLLTGNHLRRLHFPEGNPVTQGRKARAALQRLGDLGVIVRLARRVGGIRAGSEGLVVGLSGWGHAVLDVGHQPARRHRRVPETKPAFEAHTLAITELYVQLFERHRTGRAELLEFRGEPASWRRFGGMGGETVTLKPDAYTRLGVGEYELAAFIEQDMATESLTTIASKLGVYVRYWQSGLEQRARGFFPLVWWLVPTAARAEAIGRVIRALPAEAQALFAVSLSAEAADVLTSPPPSGGGA